MGSIGVGPGFSVGGKRVAVGDDEAVGFGCGRRSSTKEMGSDDYIIRSLELPARPT